MHKNKSRTQTTKKQRVGVSLPLRSLAPTSGGNGLCVELLVTSEMKMQKRSY